MPKLLLLSSSGAYKLLLNTILLHPIFKFTIFLFGCICGRFYLTSSRMVFFERYNITISLMSLVVIILFYKYDVVSNVVLDAGILSIAYFPFVLSICSFNGKILQMFSWQPFIFLGEISYSIYIMQAPVEHYFEYLFTGGKAFNTSFQFFSYTLFLIFICSLLYYLYEIPAKKYIIQFYKSRTQKRPSLVGAY